MPGPEEGTVGDHPWNVPRPFVLDMTEAEIELGYRPVTTYAKAVPETVAWLVEAMRRSPLARGAHRLAVSRDDVRLRGRGRVPARARGLNGPQAARRGRDRLALECESEMAIARVAGPSGSLQEAKEWGLDREDLLGIYRNLLTTRGIEERGQILYRQGKIPGSFYTGRGNEGSSVAVATAMGPDDVSAPCIATWGSTSLAESSRGGSSPTTWRGWAA